MIDRNRILREIEQQLGDDGHIVMAEFMLERLEAAGCIAFDAARGYQWSADWDDDHPAWNAAVADWIATGRKVFRLRDGDSGVEKIIEAESMQAAIEEARDWAEDADYEERVMARVHINELGGDRDSETIEVEAGPLPQPPETDCGTEDDDHEWTSPYDIVGGCRENPGVWSKGGTRVIFQYVCSRCGLSKTVDHAGEQRNPGQIEESIEYTLENHQ